MVQPVYNKVLVEVDYEWKEEHITKSGVIGVSFENEIDRTAGSQRKGKVIAIPRAVSKDHHFLKLVQETVKEGDTLYFHFNSITPDARIQLNIKDKYLYLVDMDQIFCIVRDGEIIMYGGRVLAEPIYDSDVEDIGGMRVRKSASGIITEINVSHNVKRATLAHIGNPLLGQRKLNASPGDTIVYDEDADFENEIEGKKYFCMIQEDLLMKEI